MLSGTYTGTLGATGTPGTFANTQQFVVTGGTGRFLGSSGSFTGTGTVIFATGVPPISFETLAGTIDAPAVPEPMTWMLMLTGFGLTGGALRSRRSMPAT